MRKAISFQPSAIGLEFHPSPHSNDQTLLEEIQVNILALMAES